MIAGWVFSNICQSSCGLSKRFLSMKGLLVVRKLTVSPQYSCLSRISATVAAHQLYGTAGSLLHFLPILFHYSVGVSTFSERSCLAICDGLNPEHTSQRFVLPPLRQALQQSIRLCFRDFSYTRKADLVVSGLSDISLLCITLRTLSLPIADLLPKRRNAQNLTPLYGFEAILGVFFRVTKKRRIATTLLSRSEDGAKKHYSIICCTFSFCLQPLCRWLRHH